MWSKLVTVATVALSSLAAVEASNAAYQFSQLTQTHRNLRTKMIEQQLLNAHKEATNSSTTNFRFLNANTTKYRVTSLPDVPYDVGEMYAGNIPISTNDSSRTLFFVFQPTIGAPVDEITIWLNGGPGCSSLDGFFQENGRFLWQPGVYGVQENPYSWVNATNMMFVDQPVGTGYSTGQVRAKSSIDVAREFADFFRNFETTFGIKKFKIYVTGESYAGRWVPYIAAEMLNRKNKDYFNLAGALVYDPVIGAFTYTQEQVPVVPLVQNNNNLFQFNSSYLSTLTALHAKCGYKGVLDKYLQFPPPGNQPPAPVQVSNECDLFDDVNNAALTLNPCFNIYGINQGCPLLGDVLSFPTELFYNPGGVPSYITYFNRTDVKKALHAPVNQSWEICGGPVFSTHGGGPEGYGDISPDPIQKVLPQVIEGTNRVLVGNGDYDMIIITNGTLLAIQNMTWNGKLGFQQRPSTPIDVQIPDLMYQQVFADNGLAGVDGPQGIVGTQHYERGLMWVETFASGHMQPEDQPRASYRHLLWLLNRTQTI